MTEKKMKLVFAPGAFDTFEGTQEELNELVAEIQRMFDSGEMLEKSRQVDINELIEEDPDIANVLARQLDDDNDGRLLQ